MMNKPMVWDVAALLVPLMDFTARAGLYPGNVLHDAAELILEQMDYWLDQHEKDFLAAAIVYLNKQEENVNG